MKKIFWLIMNDVAVDGDDDDDDGDHDDEYDVVG